MLTLEQRAEDQSQQTRRTSPSSDRSEPEEGAQPSSPARGCPSIRRHFLSTTIGAQRGSRRPQQEETYQFRRLVLAFVDEVLKRILKTQRGTAGRGWRRREGRAEEGGASRSQSALHMHVLVCICSNVRQSDKITSMTQVCSHTIACSCLACILSTPGCFHCTVQIGRPMAAILFLVTLHVLTLLGQAIRCGTSPQGRRKGGGGVPTDGRRQGRGGAGVRSHRTRLNGTARAAHLTHIPCPFPIVSVTSECPL